MIGNYWGDRKYYAVDIELSIVFVLIRSEELGTENYNKAELLAPVVFLDIINMFVIFSCLCSSD